MTLLAVRGHIAKKEYGWTPIFIATAPHHGLVGCYRQRHHRDKRPKYFLWTDLTLSARQSLPIYQKRWSIEVDSFHIKQYFGLTDFRVQSYEATEKWFAIVFVALAFLQWRFNHAPSEEHLRSLADVVRHHRYKHARILLEMACQEAAQLADYRPVLQRFLCQPT